MATACQREEEAVSQQGCGEEEDGAGQLWACDSNQSFSFALKDLMRKTGGRAAAQC